MTHQTICCAYCDLTPQDVQGCLAVIGEGNAVNLTSAKEELPRTTLVAITRDGKEIVAVGVIKHKREPYATKIAKESGFAFDETIHELGYVAVKTSHRGRGLSKEITSLLMSSFTTRPIFATTSDKHMKRNLSKQGFAPQGKEWTGTTDNVLSLWMTAL